jgi:hypothetical protein
MTEKSSLLIRVIVMVLGLVFIILAIDVIAIPIGLDPLLVIARVISAVALVFIGSGFIVWGTR